MVAFIQCGARRICLGFKYARLKEEVMRQSGLPKNDALDITHPNPFGGKGPYRLGSLARWRSTLNERENP
jgi:hypothetical protein